MRSNGEVLGPLRENSASGRLRAADCMLAALTLYYNVTNAGTTTVPGPNSVAQALSVGICLVAASPGSKRL